ncbi:MAG: class I SAM-dependent methyltransferase [Candidatus Methanofastidiosia archaeon]
MCSQNSSRRSPHYGYYALGVLMGIAAAFALVGMAVAVFVSRYVGIAMCAFGGYLMGAYLISLYWFNQSKAFNFSPFLTLQGTEKVLDVGCGLGKMTVGVAAQLTTGRAIGIDIWNTVEIPGNSPLAAYENAMAESVEDKVEFLSGNVLDLPFKDNTFDLVTSGSVLNNVSREEGKIRALEEIYRVLTPGGRFFLLEPLRDLRGFIIFSPFAFSQLLPKETWIELLEKAHFVNLEYHYDGTGILIVQKL